MLRLGGPEPHGRRSGVVHILTDTEAEALGAARALASLLGHQGTLDVAAVEDRDLGGAAAGVGASGPTTCTRSSTALLDEGTGSRAARQRWAPNIVTTLGRLGGRTVGVIANNPLRLGGCLDSLVGREGRAVRADVRRVRRAAGRRSSTCPATCPASARSGTASYAAAPSCCTRSPSASCRGSRW